MRMLWLDVRYDLDMLSEFCCCEIGLTIERTKRSSLEVAVGDRAVICFKNFENEDDCVMGFVGTGWHTHGDLTFSGEDGRYVVLDALDLLSGLCDGEVLICDLEVGGRLEDRWLVHKEFNDEFRYLLPGERIIVRRACCSDSRSGSS